MLPMGYAGIFSAFLGRGPRAFCFGNFSAFNPKLGKFLHSFFIVFFKQGRLNCNDSLLFLIICFILIKSPLKMKAICKLY